VPATPEDTEQLIRRIAFIRETHYGGFWDFTSDLSHGDTAYTNLSLGAHTDTTYFTDPAGLQLFHLLSHTPAAKDGTAASGGESLLVDGFFAAKILREVHPKAYEVLSSVCFSTHSAGDDSTLVKPLKKGGYPILEHDKSTGRLVQVRYNNDDRSVLTIAEDQVLPFYDALSKWHSILTHSDSEYWSQLTPGTALSESAACWQAFFPLTNISFPCSI
jgi:trimethyllysine dioxygenase